MSALKATNSTLSHTHLSLSLYNMVSKNQVVAENPKFRAHIFSSKMIGTESKNIDNIVAARSLLANTLEKSKAIASALDQTGPNLHKILQKLPSFESPNLENYSFMTIGDHIDHAVGPAAAVVKVYAVVSELESLVFSSPFDDPSACLPVVRRLEESLRFLADNCALAIQWLEGIVEFMEKKAVSGGFCLLNVHKSLRILRKMKDSNESSRLPGGSLSFAFNKLGTHFRRLLIQNGMLSGPEIRDLQAIFEMLSANGRREKCLSIYVEARGTCARESLEALDLGYLEIVVSESDEVQSLEAHIDKWIKDLEIVVKDLFEPEHKLCNEVFKNCGSSSSSSSSDHCFAKIVSRSGFPSFLQFGNKVAKCKKDPFKLLKLLDMFEVMNNLRLDFNKLFGGEACEDIRTLTRDLIRSVVNGVCEIFLELPEQVKAQRGSPPPSDGGIPRLVCFVTEYCNNLLGKKYRPILEQVLAIYHIWNNEKCQEGFITFQVYSILKEIAVNLDAWSKTYESTSLSCLFMMNNHSYFCSLKSTNKNLGDMMGDSWLAAHEQYRDYYAALYLRESWGKLVAILSFPGSGRKGSGSGNGNAKDVLKKRLRAFNEAFEEMYAKQSGWAVCEERLREKICLLVVKGLVPVYGSFLQSFGIVVEQEPLASNYVKYSVHKMENMLSTLFQPKPRKFGSSREAVANVNFVGKIASAVTNQFCSLTVT